MAKRSIKRNSRAVALLACIALAIALLPATASAEGGPETGMPLAASALGATRESSGQCGDGVTYALDDSGTLTISGTGAMTNFSSPYDVPWYTSLERIKKVVIKNGVTSIGDFAFYGCANLGSVVIPPGVTSIGNDAFYLCKSLASVEIPPGVIFIGSSAFVGCSNLASVEIPENVAVISKYAFSDLSNLRDVYYRGNKSAWDMLVSHYPDTGLPPVGSSSPNVHFASNSGECGTSLYWTLYDDGATLVISGTGEMYDYYSDHFGVAPWYSYRGSITALVIGDGVTYIGEFAFNDCTELQFHTDGSHFIRIPPSVKKIGQYAFMGCSSMYAVGIAGEHGKPSNVKSIGENAFKFAGTRPTEIYIDTYEGQVAEDADSWRGEAKVIWYWSKISAAANPTAGGTVTVTGATPLDENWIYDKSKPATLTATAKSGYTFVSWTNGEGNVVSTDPSFTLSDKSGNQDLTANFGLSLTITAKDQEYVYTGKQQGEGDAAYEDPAVIKTKVTVEGQLAEGDKITSLVMTGMQTSAGAYEDEIKITGCEIGEHTGNYAITFKNGTLTIAPAKLTVYTGSATKAYDGKALTNSDASITGLVNGETATVEATGSQTEVGSSPNTYSIKWGTADPKNYTVTERLGTLTVEAAPAKKGTLTFDLAGGTLDGKTGTVTVEANVGDTVKLPGAPTKDGYAFKFWKGSEYAAEAEYKVEGDHAFTAEWVAVHTVTFDANGHGKAPDTQTVEHGGKAKRPASPTADGYTFGGWYTDKACKEAYDFSKPVTEDITLYAKWTKKSSSGSGTSPKTGDPLAGALAVALALAAASALALALSRRMRRD